MRIKLASLQYYIAAFIFGIIASYATAPTSYWPCILIGLAALFFLTYKVNHTHQSFLIGWLFGFGYFVVGLSWIGNALLVEGNDFAWAWPLAVCALPAVLSFFPALACYIAKTISTQSKLPYFISFLFLLSASEVARGYLFTGFPWNLYGYAWGEVLPAIQILSLITVYGLSALTIFWSACLGQALITPDTKYKVAFILLFIVTCGWNYHYGHTQLRNNSTIEYHENLQAKIIQPNISQEEKWAPDKVLKHFETLLAMSENKDPEAPPTLIIWPETATSYLFLQNDTHLQRISKMLQSFPNGAELITGALLREKQKITNSLVSINNTGTIIHQYDKSHLVPFGEYIPFQNWIPLKTVTGFSGFSAGGGRKTIPTIQGITFSPLICYEILFPKKVALSESPPNIIINVTNDAWYGDSSGPYQHLQKARFRAIEEKTPVLRVAGTGISAVIGPYGRIIQKSKLLKKNEFTALLPKKS